MMIIGIMIPKYKYDMILEIKKKGKDILVTGRGGP
jgi:hypothetical protein